jgi:O-acetyl-ADP-ribose deacetylase (regulator of RNase III)
MAVPTEVDVWQGEIAELEVDAIIIPANESLFMTAPVARSVRLRAGDVVERMAVDQGPAEAGTAVVTAGGQLAAPYVIHAVAVGHELRADRARLTRAIDASFEIAERLGLARLATSAIGTERGVFSAEQAADGLAEVLAERSARNAWLPGSMVVVVGSAAEATAYRAALDPLRAPAQ